MKTLNQDQALLLELRATDTGVNAQAIQMSWQAITYDLEGSNAFLLVNPSRYDGGHHCYLKPRLRISPEAKATVAIDEYILNCARAKPFDAVLQKFMDSVMSEYIITHNAKRLKRLLKNAGVANEVVNRYKIICLESLARQHAKKRSDYSLPTLFCSAAGADVIRDMRNYYNGKHDAQFLLVAFKYYQAICGAGGFESTYRKSLDPSFDAVRFYVNEERPQIYARYYARKEGKAGE